MAIQHVKGDFFDHEFGAQHREFGFHGSAPSGPIRHDGHLADHPADEDKVMDHYAHGGEIHGEHHPHGHHVVHTEHKPDGRIIEHHAHGGHTVHHPHGMVSHHHHDGSPVHAAHGGFEHDREAEYVHRPENEHLIHGEHRRHGGEMEHKRREHRRHGGPMLHEERGEPHEGKMMEREGDAHGGRAGRRHRADGGRMEHEEGREHRRHGGEARHHEDGDEAQDKRMIKKAFSEHDRELHHGEHTELHLAHGGFAGRRVRLPRDMMPAGERPHSPINTPPRSPNVTSTPANDMAGGQMPFGVQPSSEPPMPGGGDMAHMHRGGRTHRR